MKRLCLPSIVLLLLLVFFRLQAVSAQTQVLTVDEAVSMALKANYDIQIARGDADIAHLNNTRGNAGMLPVLNLVVNENFTLNAFQQKLANGTEFVAAGAPFNTSSAGLQLSWPLFDGRRMQISKNRLEQTSALGQLNLKSMVQTTVANVLLA